MQNNSEYPKDSISERMEKIVQRLKPADYTYMWWANGVRDLSSSRRMNILTGNYGMSIDPYNINIDKLGPVLSPISSRDAARPDNNAIEILGTLSTKFYVRCNGKNYTSQYAPDGMESFRDDPKFHEWVSLPQGNCDLNFKNYKYRIIESGRLVQRFDIIDFIFSDGIELSPFTGHMEIQAMPEYFSLIYNLFPVYSMENVDLSISVEIDKQYSEIMWLNDIPGSRAVCLRNEYGAGITFAAPELPNGTPSITYSNNVLTFGLTGQRFKEPDKNSGYEPVRQPYWERKGFNIFVVPSRNASVSDALGILEIDKIQIKSVQGSTIDNKFKVNDTGFDPERGIIEVKLENFPITPASDKYQDELERVFFTLTNPTGDTRRVPVVFSLFCNEKVPQEMNGSGGFVGILCERIQGGGHGVPAGNFVQTSKNWHYRLLENPPLLYDMPWKRLTTLIDVPAHSSIEYELTTVYQNWGNVNKVSHSQLCLIGWGANQLWDVMSWGSIFENICYEPEGAQRYDGAMIDDVRPLFVPGMNKQKWSATGNVGGGNFLVYFKERIRQFQKCVKTSYLKHGPNLTEVDYNYITADGAIEANITASAGRTNDIVRVYHRIRYKVLKDISFTRLAFYQLGSDGYNDHAVGKLAYGNAQGAIEADIAAFPFRDSTGERYMDGMRGIPLPGNNPWVSLYEEQVPGEQNFPFANRGMIIRYWRARLGGSYVEIPHVSVFQTRAWAKDSVNWELSPPPGIDTLMTGDFVECDIEYIVVPQYFNDYYGPQKDLISRMYGKEPNGQYEGNGDNTWKPILFQANTNAVVAYALKGKLLRTNPILIKADCESAEVTVIGGAGYLPITITGLPNYKGYVLEEQIEGVWMKVDQSKHGNDYWQCDFDQDNGTYTITYNVFRNANDSTTAYRLRKE